MSDDERAILEVLEELETMGLVVRAVDEVSGETRWYALEVLNRDVGEAH